MTTTVHSFACPECYTEEKVVGAFIGRLDCPECGTEMNHRGSLGGL